jgi:hypothetical protein
MDEKRFLKSMARQDKQEMEEFEQNQQVEKDAKRRRALIAKQKQKLARELQALEDPDALERIE